MGLSDNTVVKFVIDALTKLLDIVNKLSDWLPGVASSFAKFGLMLGSLKIGSKIFDAFLSSYTAIGNSAVGLGKINLALASTFKTLKAASGISLSSLIAG